MVNYIIAVIFIVILLFGALRAYQFLKLPRESKGKKKAPHLARTPNLHDLIFSKQDTGSPEDTHRDQDGPSLK